jgi:hypothetical protein
MHNLDQRHHAELAKRIRQHGYEFNDRGIHVPAMGISIGGALKVTDYRDGSVGLTDIDANLLLTEGLTHLVNVLLPPTGGYSQITSWYIAPYSNDYTPVNTLTAATFTATAGEFTNYAGSTRLGLTIAAAATSPSQGNSANTALMTVNAAGPFNIYGGGILSASAKSATNGKALAAVRLDNPKLAMTNNEKLGWEYVFSAVDAG